jgi:hypothetical protein
MPIWTCTANSNIKCLINQQKSAIRLISCANYNAHTEPLFKKQKILPLEKLNYFFHLQIMRKFKKGFLPSSFNNVWQTDEIRHNNSFEITLRNRDLINIPLARPDNLLLTCQKLGKVLATKISKSSEPLLNSRQSLKNISSGCFLNATRESDQKFPPIICVLFAGGILTVHCCTPGLVDLNTANATLQATYNSCMLEINDYLFLFIYYLYLQFT